MSNNIGNIDFHFKSLEKVKDLIDQNIDLILNYRQSGHPGGSRSKVHTFLSLLCIHILNKNIMFCTRTVVYNYT